ncbi:MAG: CbtA family protein, partial [Beijerinckiaceae bacterium]|nr:CbtA family protein [Beijerinckiaceae bacterium]
ARLGPWNGTLISAAAFALVAGLAGSALPPVDEVPAGFPASALWNFRIASLTARAVLWGALGLTFGAMAQNCLGHRTSSRA